MMADDDEGRWRTNVTVLAIVNGEDRRSHKMMEEDDDGGWWTEHGPGMEHGWKINFDGKTADWESQEKIEKRRGRAEEVMGSFSRAPFWVGNWAFSWAQLRIRA